MSNKLQKVSFHSQQITVLNHENKPYIEMRSIVENIGLNWASQFKRIQRNKILNSSVVMMTMVAKDGKNRELVCLPLGYLNGWLFGIDTNRVKPEIRPTLEQYQLECFDVLYNHFMPKVAQKFPNTITTEQKYSIRKAVNERAYRTGEHHQTIYHKLYDHFKINSYENLPTSKFDEAIKFLGGISSQNTLSDNELYTLARLVFVANYMREKIQLIEPALKLIDSSYRGSFYSMSVEFKHEIEEARLIIMRETSHITTNHFTNNWNRVLPVIRQTNQLR